ncbi:MAG: DUF5916 domain-containing protein [Longimicrobiales bacterium]|nr:DUF5916 domain-containing protein [Longimicrobiales bacterium]
MTPAFLIRPAGGVRPPARVRPRGAFLSGLPLLVGSALLPGAGAAPVSGQESLNDAVPAEVLDERSSPLPRAFPATGLRQVEVEVDGRLDDAVWDEAERLSGFIQGSPEEGIPAEHDTEVRILFGDDAIYVAARMWDTEPERIGTQVVRRDGRGAFDRFGVALDTNLDRRTGYYFQVSAAGVQRDEYLFDDNRSDDAWDAVWESAVEVDDRGWTVEIRIPLSQIRYEAAATPQDWGVNFDRRRLATDEVSYYALISRQQGGRVSQFARMEGVSVTRAVRRIEARPYLLSSLHRGPAEPGNPFFDGREAQGRFGTDLRFGLGSAFTLDATVNPDFGQVEADPAVINLSAFETFFREQRPFFVQDANLLSFSLSGGQNNLFYSRRIGRSPQGGSPEGADFVDTPDAATILGAAKITGRTAGGLSVGGLLAVTQEEVGRAFLAGEQRFTDFMAEPQTQYGVLRLEQDFNGGASQVGGIVTTLNRTLPADGSFDFLTSSAFSTGLRFEHQWSDRTWALSGFFTGSHIRGDSTAITRIQRSSNHFFQRPDATRESVDSTATSMTGMEWRLELEKRRGEHWTWGVWLGELTGGMEINDLGFSRNRERLDGGFRIGYREIQPSALFRNYNLSFFTFHNFSHEALDDAGSFDSWRKAHTSGSFSLTGQGEFQNFWGARLDLSVNPDTYSRTATRGGPVMMDPGSWRAALRLNTDRRQALNLSGNVSYRDGFDRSGSQFSVGGQVEVRPSPRLELSLGPEWSVQRDPAQYVTATDEVPFEPTFGRRYIFGDLDRRTLALETRANLSLSPTLTFQLFAQPQISSGDYLGYRQLAAASSFDFRDFQEGVVVSTPGGGVGCQGGDICRTADNLWHVDLDRDGGADFDFSDRDFNFRSLVGNAVLRWEYRPGSTIFVVWQRRQSEFADVGDFDLGRDLGALFDVPADDRFIVKVNYWLGL